MMMKSQCMFVVVAALVALAVGAVPVCNKKTLCSCETPEGMIDLSPLTNRVFKCNDGQGKGEYQYSPCSMNNTAGCQDAMVCKSNVMGVNETIGKSSGASFGSKNGDVSIEYQGDDNKTSTVILKCNQSKDADFKMISDTNDEYVFELESRYACIGGPVSQATTTTKKGTTRKTTPKTTKSTTPSSTKTTTPRTTKTSGKTTKTSPKTTSKTSPKTTSKTSPKTTSKTSPKTTSKTSPKTTSKTSPRTTSKTSPKTTSKTSPKTTSKTSPKTTSKTSKTTKRTPTTPKMKTTTPNEGTVSRSSIGLAVLSSVVLMCHRLF